MVAKVKWHPGELYPRVGFIVTNLSRPAEHWILWLGKTPHFFRGAGIAPGGRGRLEHETRQGSLHVALKSVVVRPELGDLNVIIQVEEWHSSDRFGGTVRARESGHLGPESGVRRR